jgi:hypothetical protein
MPRQLTFVRKYLLLFLTPIAVSFYALQRGSDYNYDFVNIKGQLAWSILNGRLSVDSQIGGRYSFPQFNDVWNVLLFGTGHWWLPVVFWALVNSLIVVIAYFIIKELVPTMNTYLQQIVALTSLTSPIIMMQLGTGFGHLATSVFIGISLLFLLRGTKTETYRYWLLAGAYLGIAFLLRSSNIPTIPAYLLAVSIIAVNSKQLVSFVLGFSYVYFGISIPWAWYSSNAAGLPFTGIAVVPKGVVGVYVVVVILCVSPILLSSTNRHALTILRFLDTRMAVLSVRVGVAALVAYMVRKIYIVAQTGDPRFLITNLEMAKHRLVHTGSLVDNCCPVDLEVSYFDLRVQIALAIFVVATGFYFHKRSSESVRVIGVITFVTLPIFMAIAYSGYIRYGSQALPYVPVGLVAIFGMKSMKSNFARTFLVTGALLLAFPVIPGLPFVKDVPRYAQIGDSQNLLSTEELSMANNLLPAKSVVFIGGTLASLLAQQLNRQDLVWTWSQPLPREIQDSDRDYFVLYNPTEPFTASRAAETGISITECGVLRFQRLPLTICRLKPS